MPPTPLLVADQLGSHITHSIDTGYSGVAKLRDRQGIVADLNDGEVSLRVSTNHFPRINGAVRQRDG